MTSAKPYRIGMSPEIRLDDGSRMRREPHVRFCERLKVKLLGPTHHRARWEIEIYFHVLKNGCEVESLQLAAVDRIERALALFVVVAWRVTYLMRKGRSCPDLDASLFFDPDEIRGAHLLAKKKMPATMPTANEVVRLIAQIGGFLGRKSDGEPGAKTIWRGLDQVLTAADTLRALRQGLG